MEDKFYERCVVCFSDDVKLLKCKQCVYKICKHCVVDMGKLDVRLCNEDNCRYEYLDDSETCHCYVCRYKTTDLVFRCPTCTLRRNYEIDGFKEEIKERIKYHQKGLKKFHSENEELDEFGIVFFTVMDLDSGETELLSFRAGPKIKRTESTCSSII